MVAGNGTRAVVLGGSIGGLLAARVLAEHDLDVRVLDRDELRPETRERRGVPQARHMHTLLPRGRQVLEGLFPGLTRELELAGAPTGDLLGDTRIHLGGHRLRRAASGLTVCSVSRGLLEQRVRERVRDLAGVSFGEPCDVVGLVTADDGDRITGVRLLRRTDGSAEERLEAELVVDATGRGSRLPVWLEALGHAPPPEERVTVDLGYATAIYRLPADLLDGDWGTLQGPTPELPRGGVLARLDGDRWMLTLFGLLGQHPPTSLQGFRAFARSLALPDIADAVGDAEPVGDITRFRFPAGVRRRYERLRRFPHGIVPMGDALCSFDPIYGQGMTVAALQALALREHLGRDVRPAPRRVLRSLAGVVDAPWDMAAGADLTIPGVDGRRTPATSGAAAYVQRVQATAAHDERVATAFARVMSLVDPPSRLLRPTIVARAVRPRRRARGGGAPAAPSASTAGSRGSS